MTLSYGTKTATLDVTSSASTIAIALETQVFATGQFQWDIVLSEDTALIASGNLIGYNGYSGTINFATAECHQFLAGDEFKNTTIEVSISVDDKRYTLIQTGCQVFADVISDGVITPLPLGVALSEQVANARFVRRDVDQNPDAATQDVIWQNLGVETLGSDVSGAINGADSPSAANPFATISDIPSVLPAEWGNITGTLSDQTDLQSALDDKYDASNPAGYATESFVTLGLNTKLNLSGGTMTGDLSLGTNSITAHSITTVGTGNFGSVLSSGLVNVGNTTGSIQCFIGNGASSTGALKQIEIGTNGLSGSTTNILIGTGSGGQNNITIRGNVIFGAGAIFNNKVNFTSVNGTAGLNIGIGGTDTASTTAGDMWIASSGSALNYRDGLGSWRILATRNLSNTFTVPQIVQTPAGTTSAALRVTQLGTGNALVVEDGSSQNPDTDAFVIDASGNVGVGVNSSTFTATSKVEVVGNVKADTFSNSSGPTFSIDSTASHTSGSSTLDAIVTIGGVQYRIALRPA
jgi:hypothetical protein